MIAEEITVRFKLTFEEFGGVARASMKHYHVVRNFLIILFIIHLLEVGFMWLGGYLSSSVWWLLVVLLSFVVLAGLYFLRINQQIRRSFRKEPVWQTEVWAKYSDRGIFTKTSSSASSHEWDYFSEVLETEEAFILLRSNRQTWIALKRAFTNQPQLTAFRQLLQRHLPVRAIS